MLVAAVVDREMRSSDGIEVHADASLALIRAWRISTCCCQVFFAAAARSDSLMVHEVEAGPRTGQNAEARAVASVCERQWMDLGSLRGVSEIKSHDILRRRRRTG